MITIIDYGMGNLRSVHKAFETYTRDVIISSSPEDVVSADKVVLPGVGSFGKAMSELKKRNLMGAIGSAIEQGVLFLGICLGLQLLFTESEEGGVVQGLGVFRGRVIRFDRDGRGGIKVPHMGWNRIGILRERDGRGILKDVEEDSFMYFVHSYYVMPEDKGTILCETDYGVKFASGIEKENVFGFQFHPEKSQRQGLRIIKNFVEI